MVLKEIKYRNYKIKLVKLTKKQAKKDNMWGCYYPNKSTIAIQEKLSKPIFLDTLLHEICRMIADKSSIRLKNLGEEGICTFIGSELSKVFLQNPRLVNLIKRKVAKK